MIALALFVQAPAESSPPFTASIIDNEIYLMSTSGSRLTARPLTHDGIPKRLPTLSPSGDGLMYVVDHPVPNSAPKEEIILLDLGGNVRKRITPEGDVPREFDRLDWIDEHRIGAMACGHANCIYWVINPASGKTIEVMSGGFEYTWSHNRQFVATWGVAYNCDEPHERETGCPMHDSVSLDPGHATYPPESAGNFDDSYRFSHSHDIGTSTPVFIWSPDDKWVAFTDLIGPEDDWYVVILSPGGNMLRDTLPIDPDYKATLEWLDDTHLDVRTSTQVFHFAVKGARFSELREGTDVSKRP
jgi:hypothetical protein